jgi:hypothetical protein
MVWFAIFHLDLGLQALPATFGASGAPQPHLLLVPKNKTHSSSGPYPGIPEPGCYHQVLTRAILSPPPTLRASLGLWNQRDVIRSGWDHFAAEQPGDGCLTSLCLHFSSAKWQCECSLLGVQAKVEGMCCFTGENKALPLNVREGGSQGLLPLSSLTVVLPAHVGQSSSGLLPGTRWGPSEPPSILSRSCSSFCRTEIVMMSGACPAQLPSQKL